MEQEFEEMMKSVNRAAVSVALLFGTVPAQAADVLFNGSVTNAVSNVGAPTCSSGFHTFVSGAAGTSLTLGAFTYSSDVCQAVGQPIIGTFNIVLENGGSFGGTQSGLATPIAFTNGRPTLLSLLIDYTITGGTGAYAGATGSFVGRGTINASSSPSLISLNFAPLPEPATWAMMLIGFAGIGAAMRRSWGRAVMQVA